jgi:hypothetical protein
MAPLVEVLNVAVGRHLLNNNHFWDDQPQTYIRGPDIYKHHVRVGATRTRPMSSVTEFASRPRFLRLVHHASCSDMCGQLVLFIAWTPHSQEPYSNEDVCQCSEYTFLDTAVPWLRILGAVVGFEDSGPSRYSPHSSLNHFRPFPHRPLPYQARFPVKQELIHQRRERSIRMC